MTTGMLDQSKVIQFGEARLRMRGRLGWKDERCKHLQLTYDDNGEIVTCDDCNMQIAPFWAMKMLASHYEKALAVVNQRRQRLAEETSRSLHLIAARKVESAWKKRGTVPCCPHCGLGILPQDGFGETQINRKIEMARRRAAPLHRPT